MIKSKLFLLLLLKAAFLTLLVYYYSIGLAPDEAQYWTWSQQLDWGYFSKPPGIAWQIFATTKLFGNTLFGIRAGAIIIGFALAWVLFRLAKVCNLDDRSGFWAAVTLAFSPLGIYLSFASTTDAGAILFLTLAVATAAKGFQRSCGPNYLLCGLWILCGALYKWTVFIYWPAILCFLPFYPQLRKKSLLGAIVISLFAFLPTLYWNMTHDFATFRHVFATLFVGGGEARSGNFFDFLGAQIALISPVFFVLLFLALFMLVKHLKKHPLARISHQHSSRFGQTVFPDDKERPEGRVKLTLPRGYLKSDGETDGQSGRTVGEKCGLGLLFAAFFPLLALLFFAAAFFKHMQPNWACFLYPPGFAVIAWYGVQSKERRVWLHIGTWLSVVMTLLSLSLVWIQKESVVSQFPLPYRINPFRQSLGWEQLTPALQEAGYDAKKNFLLSDKYQLSSLLSFYGPEQKRAYFFNLGTSRKNQFSYWPQADQNEKGKTGYFVLVENREASELGWYEPHYLERLAPYFKKVEYKGAYPLYSVYGKPVKYALIFQGQNYNGTLPMQRDKF